MISNRLRKLEESANQRESERAREQLALINTLSEDELAVCTACRLTPIILNIKERIRMGDAIRSSPWRKEQINLIIDRVARCISLQAESKFDEIENRVRRLGLLMENERFDRSIFNR